jgi:hypothetical protein
MRSHRKNFVKQNPAARVRAPQIFFARPLREMYRATICAAFCSSPLRGLRKSATARIANVFAASGRPQRNKHLPSSADHYSTAHRALSLARRSKIFSTDHSQARKNFSEQCSAVCSKNFSCTAMTAWRVSADSIACSRLIADASHLLSTASLFLFYSSVQTQPLAKKAERC